MADPRAQEHLALARELEQRDADVADRIESVTAVLRRVDATRARATELHAGLERIPGEIRQAEVDERDARVREAEAHDELAGIERRHEELSRSRRSGSDAQERALRALLRAEVAAADATTSVMRARGRLEELVREEAVLQTDAEELSTESREVAAAVAAEPRLSESGRAVPGETLDEIEEWAARAHAALVVVRGGLESERERLVVEANGLAAAVLDDHGGGASVALVRRRLEETLAG
jgi:ribosome-binding ATPase YchF (GTP1/OBG family)